MTFLLGGFATTEAQSNQKGGKIRTVIERFLTFDEIKKLKRQGLWYFVLNTIFAKYLFVYKAKRIHRR